MSLITITLQQPVATLQTTLLMDSTPKPRQPTFIAFKKHDFVFFFAKSNLFFSSSCIHNYQGDYLCNECFQLIMLSDPKNPQNYPHFCNPKLSCGTSCSPNQIIVKFCHRIAIIFPVRDDIIPLTLAERLSLHQMVGNS